MAKSLDTCACLGEAKESWPKRIPRHCPAGTARLADHVLSPFPRHPISPRHRQEVQDPKLHPGGSCRKSLQRPGPVDPTSPAGHNWGKKGRDDPQVSGVHVLLRHTGLGLHRVTSQTSGTYYGARRSEGQVAATETKEYPLKAG